jgi:hypothetical protein
VVYFNVVVMVGRRRMDAPYPLPTRPGKLLRACDSGHDPAAFLLTRRMHRVANPNPPLGAGQTVSVIAAGTGATVSVTLPPIDTRHVFSGGIRHGSTDLEGFHHFAAPPGLVIQQWTAILIPAHTVFAIDAGGNRSPLAVALRVTPTHQSSLDAPFDAEVEVLDPTNHTTVLAGKLRSTFFPLNWTQGQVLQAIYQGYLNYVRDNGFLPIGMGLDTVTDANVGMVLRVKAGSRGTPRLIYSGYPTDLSRALPLPRRHDRLCVRTRPAIWCQDSGARLRRRALFGIMEASFHPREEVSMAAALPSEKEVLVSGARSAAANDTTKVKFAANDRGWPLIRFEPDEPALSLVGEFLRSDVDINLTSCDLLLESMESVLADKEARWRWNGNSFIIEVEKSWSRLIDKYGDGYEGERTATVATAGLFQIIHAWREFVSELPRQREFENSPTSCQDRQEAN